MLLLKPQYGYYATNQQRKTLMNNLLFSFLGCIAASGLAYLGINEFVLNGAFPFWPALSIGLVMGFISWLVLCVSGTEKTLSASLIGGSTLGGLFLVLGTLAMFSSNAGAAPFSLATTVETMFLLGIFSGLGFVAGNKVR